VGFATARLNDGTEGQFVFGDVAFSQGPSRDSESSAAHARKLDAYSSKFEKNFDFKITTYQEGVKQTVGQKAGADVLVPHR
jgi:hypothetical protein